MTDAPKDDAPAVLSGTGRRKAQHGNSNSEQRARVLRALESGPVTTLYARRELDVMHPGGRVMELRRAGHRIDTVWTEAPTECGRIHRVGLYVLRRGGANDSCGDGASESKSPQIAA